MCSFNLFFIIYLQSGSPENMRCRYALWLSASALLVLLANRGEKCFVEGVPISETYGKSLAIFIFSEFVFYTIEKMFRYPTFFFLAV